MEFLMIPVVLGLVVLWMGSLISGVSLQIRRMQDLGWAPGAVYGYVAATIAWVFIELCFLQVLKQILWRLGHSSGAGVAVLS